MHVFAARPLAASLVILLGQGYKHQLAQTWMMLALSSSLVRFLWHLESTLPQIVGDAHLHDETTMQPQTPCWYWPQAAHLEDHAGPARPPDLGAIARYRTLCICESHITICHRVTSASTARQACSRCVLLASLREAQVTTLYTMMVPARPRRALGLLPGREQSSPTTSRSTLWPSALACSAASPKLSLSPAASTPV